TGGIAVLNQCQFNYDVAVTFAYTGNKPFGGGLLIELCESTMSESYAYGSGKQIQDTNRMLVIRDCIFDTNIGDCSGAVTVIGARTLLQEERFQFLHCLFENNIAGSEFEHPEDPFGDDVYFYIADASSIVYNETSTSQNSTTSIRSSFFINCSSYSYTPLVNFWKNTGGTDKLDQLLLANVVQQQFILYVALTGNNTNAGSKQSPLRMISHALAILNKSEGYKDVIVMKGFFDEPMFITRDISFTITGQGYHATTICNSKTKENSVIWTMAGSNVIMQDFTLYRFSELSTTARLIDCDPGSRFIIRRCVVSNDPTAKYGDKFNAGLFCGVVTSGGFYDTIFHNSQMTDVSPIMINCSDSEFDFDSVNTLNSQCHFNSADDEPETNPVEIFFEFYNATFKRITSNEVYTPFIAIISTPSLGVSFDLCLFEENTFILIQIRQSYFDITKGQIKQIQFQHCTWISNGKTWRSDGQVWQPHQTVESGAITVHYAYYPDNLVFQTGLEDCKVDIQKIVVDNCVFVDSIGSEANIVLIEDVINDMNLITFNNCIYGSTRSDGTSLNYAQFTYNVATKEKDPIISASFSGWSDFTSTSPNRNKVIDSTSTLIDGELTSFVSMILRSNNEYNIQFQTGIMVNETSLSIRHNKLSISKDDNVQEEGIYTDPYSSSLIAVEQSGEISMKSIVILHFYEKSLNSVIQVKDEAKFTGIQLIFRPIEEQLSGMATLPTTEQTSPYLLCLGGQTILESCQFIQTNFENSAAIRTMYEIGINSKEGAKSDAYNLTLK
ncbi:MAG: hypothetical protein EZS28_029472, partial [Streblomastix strix]